MFRNVRQKIRRRNGFIPFLRLEYVFWKISRDKYVKSARKRYGK